MENNVIPVVQTILTCRW